MSKPRGYELAFQHEYRLCTLSRLLLTLFVLHVICFVDVHMTSHPHVLQREDGFTCQFPEDQTDAARDALRTIARHYRQAAIFEYHWHANRRVMTQTTIPAFDELSGVQRTTEVRRIAPPRTWAANGGGGHQ